jgi:hypothetical protein
VRSQGEKRREKKSGWVGVFPPAVLPVPVARCGVGFFWLVGSGVGFAPPRWLAPAVFPVPARWVAPLAVGVPKARFLYEASYKKAAVRLLWWAVVFRTAAFEWEYSYSKRAVPCLGAGRARSSSPRSSAVSVSCPFLVLLL